MSHPIPPISPLAGLLLLVAAGASAAPPDGSKAVSEAAFRRTVEVLASDEFAGRMPGQAGEQKTLDYLEREFRALGLKPVGAAGYRQEVPLVEITADPVAVLTVHSGRGEAALAYAADMMVWTKRVVPESRLAASPLVFVGHGIVAPEFGWNDYAGVDMHGKTAVVLVNDPGYRDPALFRGRKMTYYGRWTYKFEEAMRQGAAAALIVHQTGPAAYGWEVVRNSNNGPQLEEDATDDHLGRIAVEGWLSLSAAERICALAGKDFPALEQAATRRGFRAVPLDVEADLTLRNAIRRTRSANVVGMVRGRTHPDEFIIYTAHWDHFGRQPGAAGEPERIYHGAVDNATGVAGIMQIANAFVHAGKAPQRSLLFMAPTGEEQGLVGSAYYAAHPLVPLARTVATINIDEMKPLGRTRDIEVVGFGASDLEDYLKEAAAGQQRVITPDHEPEKGYYFRSDHFSLAKRGVPALYTASGTDSRTQPAGWGAAQVDDFTAHRYHKPTDTYDAGWDVSGALEDIQLLYAVGNRVANERRWPAWYPGSEFRAIREQSLKAASP